ncbi:MotA/TolQ/ExbB proton channel family protein [Saccharibacter floricola DSM 15669]|uniref:MotA/TolQ/ExbB proton channel family protein n=2 Tax=Saccharibacter TaxID=231052 RepID=A0ABQ0NX11_9PROT|nr:MotA/TolQ/ExbB proton channel family protein [Saccharibacter floricola DSM 15669]
MDEGREISRYITQLLVFLGLLGTFYGLLLTVRSIADVIGGMPSGGSDLTAMFDHVKTGLVQPLGGMSTAFSGSMFGLAGALVLGFLDLTTGQAQTRFFNDIEEWFAGITRVDGSPSRPSVSLSDPAELASLSETMETWLPRVQDFMRLTTENVSLLQQNISMLRKNAHDAEESRAAVLSALKELTKAVREQRYNDPATPQILQQIERELTGLRSDLHHERSLSRED